MAEQGQQKSFNADGVPEDAWRKPHWVTPVVSASALWAVLGLLIYSMASTGQQELLAQIRYFVRGYEGSKTLIIAGIVLLALLVLTVLVIIIAYIAWRFMFYALVDSGIHVRSGILFKQHQHTRWDRIQSVEIQQKLFGRIFGFGSVRIESAAGDGTVDIGLLRMEDCANLRREVLRGQANARAGLPIEVGDPAIGAVAPETSHIPVFDPDDEELDELIYELPTARLLAVTILNPATVIGAIIVAASIVGQTVASGESIVFLVVGLATALFQWSSSLFNQYGSKVFVSENGLRLRAGLTKLVTQTIPPSRVHAVSISQPMLWRRMDWWRIGITIAGSSTAEDVTDNRLLIVPVGSRTEVFAVLWTILPYLGVDDAASFLMEAMYGKNSGKYFTGAPRRGRWLDPIGWRGRGMSLTPNVAAFRTGRLRRNVSLILQDHTQSTSVKEGPLQRRLGLATLKLDTVAGVVPTQMANFGRAELANLVWEENELSRQARARGVTESIADWKQRISAARIHRS
ncbi:MAG: PH domain-containing protein [Trueperella sp.]|nr:PH domain-containing protein [Trueperella sp.]